MAWLKSQHIRQFLTLKAVDVSQLNSYWQHQIVHTNIFCNNVFQENLTMLSKSCIEQLSILTTLFELLAWFCAFYIVNIHPLWNCNRHATCCSSMVKMQHLFMRVEILLHIKLYLSYWCDGRYFTFGTIKFFVIRKLLPHTHWAEGSVILDTHLYFTLAEHPSVTSFELVYETLNEPRYSYFTLQ